MDLTPILNADLPVQIHVIAALEAVALTPFALFRKKRDRLHKLAGYAWVTNMVVAAASSFWIKEIRIVGPYSYIHILSLITLVNVVLAIRAVRNRNIAAHRSIMRQTAFWALGVAGSLTLLPGRRMHKILFGEDLTSGANHAPFIAALVLLVAIAAVFFGITDRRRRLSVKKMHRRAANSSKPEFPPSHPTNPALLTAPPCQDSAVVAELVDAQR